MKKKGDVFATSREYYALSGYSGPRHGKLWYSEDYEKLEELFKKGCTLELIAKGMGRSVGSVIPKLRSMGFVQDIGGEDFLYAIDICPQPIETPKFPEAFTQEQEIMTKVIEGIILINGTNATELSDDQIFGLIAKLEDKATSLSNIAHKPKKLLAKIDEINADIIKLVEYVDAR